MLLTLPSSFKICTDGGFTFAVNNKPTIRGILQTCISFCSSASTKTKRKSWNNFHVKLKNKLYPALTHTHTPTLTPPSIKLMYRLSSRCAGDENWQQTLGHLHRRRRRRLANDQLFAQLKSLRVVRLPYEARMCFGFYWQDKNAPCDGSLLWPCHLGRSGFTLAQTLEYM